MQVPMISSPLKQTNEIDWVAPLKYHIRSAYGDDPDRYSEECGTLNRLRQDMRGAGKDSAAGRDLLYRYYGQLEFLDLRFPVDENHIKISFTWYDAFTQKPTSQYSLAYEKASIIFNISAVLSCHAANQNRHDETGLKTAYHSFQASAGMFTYINENFLHAPSTDLSRETVKTLISIMLAQAQEVFIEKQVVAEKKPGMLAKLTAQAAYLYAQAVEGVQDNVSRAVFERVWLLVTQIKQHHTASLAQYYQGVADYEANSYGQAIARMIAAQGASKEAVRLANSVPSSMPANSNLSSETAGILLDITKKHSSIIQEKLSEFNKDNDMIYHQPVPSEANLIPIPKLPAAKPIPVSELYQGQDIQKIIGPDIFQRIVPMSVTESASLYDEEKAKLARAEAERCQVADDELTTSLDYLKLPGSLNILKGGLDHESMGVDQEFRRWCADLAGHTSFAQTFEQLTEIKRDIGTTLDSSMKQLDMEESVCEKMRSKYGNEWTQQPSSRLTSTLRTDARSYRAAVEQASISDKSLFDSHRACETDFDEMRSAGETDEADVLYQRALIKVGAGKKGVQSPGGAADTNGNLLDDDFADEDQASVSEQIERVEELVKKLHLVKKERTQVLKDFKEKIHTDDISSVLILNKKATTTQEQQLFKQELDKFRPHQNRIIQANHKQIALMKELTATYGALLKDKRVRSEQNRYESFSRQRNAVLSRYRKVHQAYLDLVSGLDRAKQFYNEMKETVESLKKNVESFVENRRGEGGQLLAAIEAAKGSGADREQTRLKELMERMSMSPSDQPSQSPIPQASLDQSNPPHRPPPLQNVYSTARSPPPSPGFPMNGMQPSNAGYNSYQQQPNTAQPARTSSRDSYNQYNPNNYAPVSPPAHQQYFSPPPNRQSTQQPSTTTYGQQQQSYAQGVPPGWQPPPPPPGPPPSQYGDYSAMQASQYPNGPGGYAADPRRSGQQRTSSTDPWAGLSAWK